MSDADVIVVGAGPAGLACARRLRGAGLEPLVLERSDGVGGRVRTDHLDGFLLDHGFQVLPTAYPELRAMLDLDRLGLGRFERGAIVRREGRFRRLTDPRHAPLRSLRALAGGLIGLRDVTAAVRLLNEPGEETTALEALRRAGVSRSTMETFFVPALRGAFLERRLDTSSRLLTFVLRAFSEGAAALPRDGMGTIARQLAEGVTVRTGAGVATVGPGAVSLETGAQLRARAVVVATAGLLDEPQHGWRGVTCLYFDAPVSPVPGPWLVLNGEGGPVNHLCVPSEVSSGYAPAGRSLVSVTVLGAGDPDPEAVEQQLRSWYGRAVGDWRHLRTYRLPRALPAYPVGGFAALPLRLADGLYACGDHREHPSLNGALLSGRRAAEAVLADLAREPLLAS